MKTLPRRITHSLLDNPITISGVAFLVLSVILIYLDMRFLRADAKNSAANLIVEAHGLLFDLLLFGIIFATLNIFTERRRKIERYKEVIDDYRRWDEKEATHRIVGSIRRLNRLEVTNIDLSFCFLQEAQLENVNLENANLFLAQLQNAKLKNVRLDNANLQAAHLQGADLGEASLRNANLYFSKLQDTEMYNADLSGANLQRANLQDASFSRQYSNSAYLIVDRDTKNVVGPEGVKTWTVRANLCGSNLCGAIALENQREELIEAGANIQHVNFVPRDAGDVENELELKREPPAQSSDWTLARMASIIKRLFRR